MAGKLPETADTLVIRNQKIPVVVREMQQSDLRFFPDNPRIYSIVRSDAKEPDQEEIQERLLAMEHVKQLIQDIRSNGGLIEPLLVKDGTFDVLEGNSGLAAYRFLAKSDPVKWGLIKCVVLPSTIEDSLIFALLGQYHTKGRKDWVPYEQAGFVYRRFKNHGVSLEAVSKEIGLSLKQVIHLIDTYQFMIDHDEIEVGRWSYYDEYLKSAKITKAKKKYPELDKMIVKKIKSAEILRAVDIRDQLPVICSISAKVLKKFVAGTLKFAEAFEAAEEAGGNNMQLGRLTKFRTWLVKPEVETALARSEGQSRAKIAYELDKIDTRVKALRKKLNHN